MRLTRLLCTKVPWYYPVVAFVLVMGCSNEKDFGGILFPRPFSVAIDDMGWNEGSSLGDEGGPWRAGVRRNFDARDYIPIVEVGKAAGMRFQGAFILAEMDRENILAAYPTTTRQGTAFDNAANIDKSQLEVMRFVQNNAAYLEFGLHGVGHEHFDNGLRTRAEWYDMENDKPWPEQDSRAHIEAFKAIMAQYGWTPENGHSFPESFVPCAYAYYWNPTGDYSTGRLLRENGVKYANTDFNWVKELNPPLETGGGFDHGLLVINRYNYGNEWFTLASLPSEPIDNFKTDIIESHWPNWLAQDDFLQHDLNQKWIEFFEDVQERPDRYLAKNTEQLFSQWLYSSYTKVSEFEPGEVVIDNTAMPYEVYENEFLGNLVLAVALQDDQHLSRAELDGEPIPACDEAGGYGYLYLPPINKAVSRLSYAIGREMISNCVLNRGTYNIYRVAQMDGTLEIDLKMYGEQTVEVRTPEPPSEITSSNPFLQVVDYNYSQSEEITRIEVKGRDMQGELGQLTLVF